MKPRRELVVSQDGAAVSVLTGRGGKIIDLTIVQLPRWPGLSRVTKLQEACAGVRKLG